MIPANGFPLPLLDQAVLDKLRGDLDNDQGVWTVFVQNFITQLPCRVERLSLTLTTRDLAGATDAILSLKTSSQMIGAKRLADMALELEQSLRQDANQADPTYALPRLAAAQLGKVKTCAQRTANLLQVYLRKHHSN